MVTDDLLDRLKMVESSGDPRAVNPKTGAMGAYQFMPGTVKMLESQGIKFDPFNESQARNAARIYLTQLVDQNKGDVDAALAQYGGFKTKDPSSYVQKVKGEPMDDLLGFIDKRIKSAAPSDFGTLEDIIQQRIVKAQQAPIQAAAEQQRILQAAVPQIDASGRLIREAPAPVKPRQIRGVGDFFEAPIGMAETVLNLGTGAFVAPLAAGEQLVRNVIEGQPNTRTDVFAKRMGQFVYQPRTEFGKENVEQIGKAFEASKLPPVLTPEFVALQAAKAPVARVPVGEPKPRYTAQEAAQVSQIVKGTAPSLQQPLPGISMQSVGAAARRDPVRIEATIASLPESDQAVARSIPVERINPVALENHAQAVNLPVPVRLTAGQATGDIVAMSKEYNQRGKNPELALRFKEQNDALVGNMDAFRDTVAPDIFSTAPADLGKIVKEGYKNLDNAIEADITAKYKRLRDAAGGQFPIDSRTLLANVEKKLSTELLTDNAPSAQMKSLTQMAENNSMTFENYLALRRNLGKVIASSKDGNERSAARFMRDELDALPLSPGAAALKPLADEARAAAKARFDLMRRDQAYGSIIEKGVPDEYVLRDFLFGAGKATQENVRQMVTNLGPQERQALSAGVLQYLRDKSINAAGDFSQAAYMKAFKELEPKMAIIMPAETVNQLRVLGDVATRVKAQPSGSFFNKSGTLVGALAEKGATAAEQTLNVLVPGASIGTMARQARAARAEAKQTQQALEPLAGTKGKKTKLKDIGK